MAEQLDPVFLRAGRGHGRCPESRYEVAQEGGAGSLDNRHMLAAVLTCLVVGISDGDTLAARCPTADAAHPYQRVKVRLAEIDAPESGQAFGRRSKEHLSALCFTQ